MIKNNKYLLFAFFSLLGLCGCGASVVYEKNYDLKNSSWYADSTLTFQFNITEIDAKYNFYYNLRNTKSYPFYNLYLTYHLEDEKGNLVKTELQNATLFDAKTGKPFGNGVGGVYTHQLLHPSLANFKFTKKGNYKFKIKQYMRKNPLEGLQAVGIRLEKAE
ncbi:MAG: gliding motility lipoprotein GldH [Cytophagia bacterium]|nr:MAG: gliding motility lipoprotein GldH [Cytophagales bacterium]TAG06940.1 MAG: gliding motility lipoprotein GldH [Cytophagia bacterium]TAG44081.1 MAG: gliding motility lipoprotein GldH [Cytophagia bacterium]TAH30009.1 MAG: gliding motility lipoprotein GldH [Cytophagales bacterium]